MILALFFMANFLFFYTMDICFATNNENKLKEVQWLLGEDYRVVSLKEVGCMEELPETQKTLEGNSLQKAEYVYQKYNIPCFADDTGLEVVALDGKPGVYSARFAGEPPDNEANMALLLKMLKGEKNRNAQFRTVITFLENGRRRQFEGFVKGTILEQKQGDEGFGYDPVFKPSGHSKSFAQMSLQEKNEISHRAIAIRKFVEYLRKHQVK